MDARATAIFIGLAAFAGVAFAVTRTSARNGPVDGVNWDSFQWDLVDAGESIVNSLDTSVAEAFDPVLPVFDFSEANQNAFLAALRAAEGTDREPDPYRTVMGYGYTLRDLSDHPYYTGEWKGAPFGNGQWSTAAGAYQIIRGTWADVRAKLRLPDFSPASQDAAALQLIAEKGALQDVRAGRFAAAVHKVRRVWASLPGANYGQGERSLEWLAQRYEESGGQLA